MPSWHPSQTAFTAGEITARMLSRVDYPVYSRAVLRMLNFMPRLQGSALRTPGTTFIDDISVNGLTGRVIPFLTVDQRRALICLQDESLKVTTDITEPSSTPGSTQLQVVANSDFDNLAGEDGGWLFDPPAYTGGEGDVLGCRYLQVDFSGVLRCICRLWKYPNLDNETFVVDQVIDVPEPNDSITFDYRLIYEANPGLDGEGYEFKLTVTTVPPDSSSIPPEAFILDETITGGIGTVTERVVSRDLPAGFTGDLYVRFFCAATEQASTPIFDLDRFAAFVDGPPLPADLPIDIDPGAVLYAEADLPDIQYVQSPYDNKPIVFVHPKYPPQELLYDPNIGSYVFRPIDFTDAPGVWATDNWPRACTAYQGRLILAGTPEQSETIWGSRPGDWYNFSQTTYNEDDPPIPDKPVIVTPDSALEITTTYRSPIQWVYGQKDLMVGSLEFEYLITSDSGLLQPGDVDVRLHSTHGSLNIQPASFGKFIAFAAEEGTRARALQRVFQDTGWIAPDLSLLADNLLITGIRRMVRMRNPHQMLVCLVGNGNLVALHWDEYAELYGWSQLNFPGDIVDICVTPTEQGEDALIALVSRTINGVRRLHVEGIFNWTYGREWVYTAATSFIRLATPGNVLTGLAYLEGQRVQVVGDRTYLGTFIVQNGTVTLEDGNGLPYNVSAATVGLGTACELGLAPPVTDQFTGGVSSDKRYSDIVVRTFGSTRPIINGTRPPARDPATPMTQGQLPDIVRENQVANLNTDTFQFVTIQENVPLPVEVLSVSGKLTSEKL